MLRESSMAYALRLYTFCYGCCFWYTLPGPCREVPFMRHRVLTESCASVVLRLSFSKWQLKNVPFACLLSGSGFSVLRGTATKCSLEPEGEKVADPSGDLGLPARPAGRGEGFLLPGRCRHRSGGKESSCWWEQIHHIFWYQVFVDEWTPWCYKQENPASNRSLP